MAEWLAGSKCGKSIFFFICAASLLGMVIIAAYACVWSDQFFGSMDGVFRNLGGLSILLAALILGGIVMPIRHTTQKLPIIEQAMMSKGRLLDDEIAAMEEALVLEAYLPGIARSRKAPTQRL